MKKQIQIYLFVISLMIFNDFLLFGESCDYIFNDRFTCNFWGLQLNIGLCPIIWPARGGIFLDGCDCIAPEINRERLPEFNHMFHLPWIIGGKFLYALYNCVDVYGELNFIQARNKHHALNNLISFVNEPNFELGHYRALGGYIGCRFYAARLFCNSTVLFVGAKLGFIHHYGILLHQIFNTIDTSCRCSKQDFFKQSTNVSGGLNVGLETCLCNGFSLLLTGEIVANQGPRGNCFVPLLNSEIAVNRIKAEVSFPITIGLAYTF